MKKRKIATLIFSAFVWSALAGCSSAQTQMPTSSPTTVPSQEVDQGEPSTGSLDFRLIGADGNDAAYDVKNVSEVGNSLLAGKTFYWLGSSVTMGTGSKGQTVAHFLEKTDGCVCIVDALAGTTLATFGKHPELSYVSRMTDSKEFDQDQKIDAFFCQISTNDCKDENIENFGEITPDDVTAMDAFDLSTAAGAVEFIIAYVHETWGCPVYFFSGSYFGDVGNGVRSNESPSGSNYAKLVDTVIQITEKWDHIDGYRVGVLDLYNNAEFNSLISDSDYEYMMQDAIHPRKAGYLVWWLPEFQQFLYTEFYK